MSIPVDDLPKPPTEPAVDDAARIQQGDSDAARPVDRALLLAIIMALILLTIQWIGLSLQRPDTLPWKRSEEFSRHFQIDINSADWIEWMQLEGIGEKTAHRIVADRELNGPFRSIDDLQRVHGIGPATLDAIRPCLTMGHATQTQSAVSGSEDSQQPTDRQSQSL